MQAAEHHQQNREKTAQSREQFFAVAGNAVKRPKVFQNRFIRHFVFGEAREIGFG
jgi:hypothetical protein